MDINRPEGWIYVICVPIFNFIAQDQCNSFSFLEPFPPEALHPFLYLRFLRIVLRMPDAAALHLVRQELLLHEIALIGMCILIILAIAQLFHQLGGCVAQMQGNRQIARLPNQFQGTVDPLVCRVALGAGGQIHRSFRQRDTPLRPSYLHHGIKSSVRQEQCVGIGQTDILGCRND